MHSNDVIVAPRSWASIAELANSLRIQLNLSKSPSFPIIEYLEQVLCNKLELLSFEVWSNAEMGVAEGYTCPNGTFIALREDVYELACEGDGRARFTAAHELGHYLMHTGVPLARITAGQIVKPYRRAEPQANQFAVELLMPRQFITTEDTAHSISARHMVSLEAADNRLRNIRKIGNNKKGSRLQSRPLELSALGLKRD